MLVYPLRTKDSFILLTLVFLCLFLFASCSETTNSTEDFQGFFKFTKSSTEFDLVDENRFEISDLVFSADGKGKLLVKYTKAQLGNGEKLGVFIKLSNDGGKSFGQERALKAMFRSDRDFNFYDFRFDQDGGAFLLTKNRNIFYIFIPC